MQSPVRTEKDLFFAHFLAHMQNAHYLREALTLSIDVNDIFRSKHLTPDQKDFVQQVAYENELSEIMPITDLWMPYPELSTTDKIHGMLGSYYSIAPDKGSRQLHGKPRELRRDYLERLGSETGTSMYKAIQLGRLADEHPALKLDATLHNEDERSWYRLSEKNKKNAIKKNFNVTGRPYNHHSFLELAIQASRDRITDVREEAPFPPTPNHGRLNTYSSGECKLSEEVFEQEVSHAKRFDSGRYEKLAKSKENISYLYEFFMNER